jgi:uracil-DNA glycosylase
MPDNRFTTLLDAVTTHLQALKSHGVRYVTVSPETLAALSQPIRRGPVAPSPQPATSARTAPVQRPAPLPSRVPAPIIDPIPLPAPEALPVVPAISVPGTPLPREAKEEAMADLRRRALACQKCPPLAGSRKNVVFGVGNIHSPLMFVGEAPGADEDTEGEPFVGLAGQLLTRIIKTMGFSRETVYIANVLKCRPDTPGQSSGNRKPTLEEMQTCLPYLLAQIDIIQPKVIVALGATAMEGLFGVPCRITKLRGIWKTFRNIPVMPTYHPAYLLRNQSLSEKRKVWEDMLQVLEKLGAPISEKQRSYFLKA